MRREKSSTRTGFTVQSRVKAGEYCNSQDVRDACKQGARDRGAKGMGDKQNNDEYMACLWSC